MWPSPQQACFASCPRWSSEQVVTASSTVARSGGADASGVLGLVACFELAEDLPSDGALETPLDLSLAVSVSTGPGVLSEVGPTWAAECQQCQPKLAPPERRARGGVSA